MSKNKQRHSRKYNKKPVIGKENILVKQKEEIPKDNYVKRQIFLYVLPISFLCLLVFCFILTDIPLVFKYISIGALVLCGFCIAIHSIAVSYKKNPHTLASHIDRKEFYGVLSVVIGVSAWFIVQFTGSLDNLTLRIDDIGKRIDGTNARIDNINNRIDEIFNVIVEKIDEK